MPNPGTTPQGSEPQNDGTDNQNQQGSESGSSQPKRKIAGKFDTIEQAVEEGYVGLERGFHQLSENVGRMTRLLESAFEEGSNNPPRGGGGVPVGRGAPGGYDPYGRYQPQSEDDIDPKEFILNPGQVLKAREERLLQMVGRVVSTAVSNAQVVNDFKAQNPDLVKHERLVQAFMAQTDQRKPLADRLADAATSTRTYLAQLRAEATGSSGRPPAGSEYVEPHRGGTGDAPVGTPQPTGMPGQSISEDEKELYDYIAERNALYSSHFGGGSKT
jgi:hypothetical protein